MIPDNGLQNSLQFVQAPVGQQFTAAFCRRTTNQTTPITATELRSIETGAIPRRQVIYTKSADTTNSILTLVPETFTLQPSTDIIFNTVVVIDNGSIELGTSSERLVTASYSLLGPKVVYTFAPPNNTARYRKNTRISRIGTGLFDLSESDDIGSMIGQGNFSNVPPFFTCGRFFLATYYYGEDISVIAGSSIKVKLGNIIFNVSS